MNQEEALIKLATVRMAINHVLRTRSMQKQAGWFKDRLQDLYLQPPIPTANYASGYGGKVDKARTMHLSDPSKFPASGVWPYDSELRKEQEKAKRRERQLDPAKVKEYEQWKEPHHNVTPSATPSVSPAQPNVVPLPPSTLQPGGLFPFR